MKKFFKNNKFLISMIFPALLIFVLFSIGFLNILDTITSKGIALITLLIITPIIFFVNGFLSQVFKKNFFIFSLPSYLVFTIVFFIWMNSSALIYFPIYLIINFLGTLFYKFDKKVVEKKAIKIEGVGFYSDKKQENG